ncbi:pilus assembly PilX N-terminal domain-containing protein [Cytobacillus sp. NCCP-133]|uniref:pilus assembly PilX N-terminal domain-containing protein n=1 Tax=Cytobacillus sp. NCCP-133 TaxID=766848 RepID=UPI00222FD3C6|nr:pilus assembly PilX N-terminal domain-containing protein [Cytobacillus sp. NCCP-133]GLB58379.1 hypothetical protein NCCP133_05120 [Cytobacillus sp. NCCP-133]
MKLCLKSQNGSALILVLFLIVFLTIAGTALLNTTTYSMKTIENNQIDQEEFYRSEGALEIVLNEMSEYTDAKGNTGPYFYLLNGESTESPYNIGSQNIDVGIQVDPMTPIIDPHSFKPGDAYNVNVELLAKKSSNSRIERKLKFTTTLSIPAIGTVDISDKAVNYVTDAIKKQNNYKVPMDTRFQLSHNMYENILTYVNENWGAVPQINVDTKQYYQFLKGFSRVNRIDLSGKNAQVYIPGDSIVLADSISITGNGNSTYSVKVDGVLIVQDFYINGNAKVVINSGIIADTIRGNSNAAEITGEAKGIDCTLLPIVCSIPSDKGEGKDIPLNTNVNSNSVNLSTHR